MRYSHGLLVPVILGGAFLAVLVSGTGCTITTNDGTTDGGSPSGQYVPDGSTSSDGSTTNDGGAGVLGFQASNLGAALDAVDTSKLIDIDVTNADDEASVECNSQSNDGCVALTANQSDGSKLQIYFAKSWKVEPQAHLRIANETPTVLVALDTIEILGRITADASDSHGIAGGYDSPPSSPKGDGPGAGTAGGSSTGSTIGGGGASFCGVGGKGGSATSALGIPGAVYGNARLTPLMGGSGGGGFGGGGGGAVQFVAGQSISVGAAGSISAGGGPGGTGSDGATGAGAGGALLFEAPTVAVAGIIAANGGGGGGGKQHAGSAGSASATPASAGDTGTPFAGGDGSGGATTLGGDGKPGDTSASAVASGGGGGAGWIRINTRSGAASIGGTLSPAFGTCASQGTLN